MRLPCTGKQDNKKKNGRTEFDVEPMAIPWPIHDQVHLKTLFETCVANLPL